MIDQSRRRLKTRLGRDWFNRVERPIVDVTEQWDATKLPGAPSGDGETRFYRCGSSFTSEMTIHSLRSLQEAFGDELNVVPDNAPYFASRIRRVCGDRGVLLAAVFATDQPG